jgi:S-adenosylmethionine:diacylglycerol 3-amino-3-carboxypropyl transferase
MNCNLRRKCGHASEPPTLVVDLVAKGKLLLSALREIFDESAYARFLARQQMASSRQAYAEFLREHELAKARRPRCC